MEAVLCEIAPCPQWSVPDMFLVGPPPEWILKDASGLLQHSHPHAAFALTEESGGHVSLRDRGGCGRGGERGWRRRRRKRVKCSAENDGGVMGGEAGVREEQGNHNRSHKVMPAWRRIGNLSDTDFHPFFLKTSCASCVDNSAVWLLHLAGIQPPLATQIQHLLLLLETFGNSFSS